jgi:hypothetical protein
MASGKTSTGSAVWLNIGDTRIRAAPLDYLLFLKLISDRPKDSADAEALMRRHRGKIDLSWLEAKLAALADSTGQNEILRRFQRLLRGDA